MQKQAPTSGRSASGARRTRMCAQACTKVSDLVVGRFIVPARPALAIVVIGIVLRGIISISISIIILVIITTTAAIFT